MNFLTLLQTVTETLAAGNVAVPIIFATIQLIRNQVAPEITDAQLIDMMEAAFVKNHERNVQLVSELRG